ncbi:hypothetical protein HRbin36_01613 [bacterium HR36]|nr:hypothetical protein HRbin36_01613 [bacterium HR36]
MNWPSTCQACYRWTQALLDGEAESLPCELAAHLQNCTTCYQRWYTAQCLRRFLQAWPVPEPAVLPNQIAHKILADRQARQVERLRLMLAASLVVTLLALVGLSSLGELGPSIPAWPVASQEIGVQPFGTLASHSVPADRQPLTPLAPAQAEVSPLAEVVAGSFAGPDLAYWFLPIALRRDVEDVLDLVSPVFAMASESQSTSFQVGSLLVDWSSIESLWLPVWDAGQNGLRLFRNLIPPIANQSNS